MFISKKTNSAKRHCKKMGSVIETNAAIYSNTWSVNIFCSREKKVINEILKNVFFEKKCKIS